MPEVLRHYKESDLPLAAMMLGILAAEVDGKFRVFYWNYMKQSLNHKSAGEKVKGLGTEVRLVFGAAFFVEADLESRIKLRITKLARSFSPEVFKHPEPSLNDLKLLFDRIRADAQIDLSEDTEVEIGWPSLAQEAVRKKMKDLLLVLDQPLPPSNPLN